MSAPMATWWTEPPPHDVQRALRRLTQLPDVVRVAVMPDVHLGGSACVGVALATRSRVYPRLIGRDVGCGVCTVPLEGASWHRRYRDEVLEVMAHAAPIRVRPRSRRVPWPDALDGHPWPVAVRQDGTLGTLGRGNHFLELQQDEGGGLWLTVHTGSRSLGPRVVDHHLRRAQSGREPWLEGEAATCFLDDVSALRAWARENRRRLLADAASGICGVLGGAVGARCIDADHDHLVREDHGEGCVFVHRKGAIAAARGACAVIPGSMGTATFHVLGRGHAAALGSASHGAGRCLSRGAARRSIRPEALRRQLGDVWVDPKKLSRLTCEAPAAFKPIEAVMRAQRELVTIARRVWPLVSHKGG